MKTKEELNALKNEVEALNKKLAELTEEELEQVAGSNATLPAFGGFIGIDPLNAKIDVEAQKADPTWEFNHQIGIDQ